MIRPHIRLFAAASSQSSVELSASGDEFDQWFKHRLADATGLDLNPPASRPAARTAVQLPGE